MRYPLEVLEPHEIEALLKACGRSRTGIRNRALLAVMWRAGLRVSEALALEPRDIDLTANTIRIRHGKGGRARVVGLDGRLEAELDRWLRLRPPGNGRLFCTLSGHPLYPSYPRNMMRRLADRAGITKRVHPHGLRHTFTAELAREGASLIDLRDALGHARSATTETYMRATGAGRSIDLMRSRQRR